MLNHLILILKGNEFYPDFIVSTISMYGANKSGEILFFIALAAMACLLSFFLGRYFLQPHLEPKHEISTEQFDRPLTAFFLILSGAAVLTTAHALGASDYGRFSFIRILIYFGSFSCLFIRRSSRFFCASQVLLPLLLLRYTRIDYSNGTETLTSHLNSIGIILLSVCILVLLGFAWQSYRHYSKTGQPKVFSSTIISVAAYFAFHLPKVSPLSLDDYHTGEMFVPFYQFAQFGLKRFVDFVSVHGELAVTYGTLHHFLLDGTAASIGHAMVLATGLFTALTSSILAFLIRGRLALALAVFVTPVIDRFYFAPIVILTFYAIEKLRHSIRIRTVVMALLNSIALPFSLLFNPASGMAIIFSSLPTQIQFAREMVKRKSYRAMLTPAIALLVAVFVLHGPLLGVVHFIRDNGTGTLQAFGLQTSLPHSPPSWMKSIPSAQIQNFAAEAFKAFKLYGWVLGTACVAFMVGRSRKLDQPLYLAMIIFPLALIPYTLGRVGQEGLDRVGAMGVLTIGFFLPLIAANRFREKKRLFPSLALTIVMGLGIRAFGELKDFHEPLSLASQSVNVKSDEVRIDGQEFGIPNLGQTFISKTRVKELEAFRALKAENSTLNMPFRYIDLTNRQIYFFLLNVPVSQLYPSHLLAINSAIQKSMNAAIDRFQPRIAWIAPLHDHEAATFPLRAYRLYRHLLIDLRFQKVETRGPLTFLTQLDIEPANAEPHMSDVDLLRNLWFRPDLGHTAIAWGKNKTELTRRLASVSLVPRSVEQGSGHTRIHFDSPISGKDVDFIEIVVRRDKPSRGESLAIDFDGTSSFSANCEGSINEALLIPIGADPKWLLGKHRSITVRFAIGNTQVDTISFYRLAK